MWRERKDEWRGEKRKRGRCVVNDENSLSAPVASVAASLLRNVLHKAERRRDRHSPCVLRGWPANYRTASLYTQSDWKRSATCFETFKVDSATHTKEWSPLAGLH